MYNIKINGVITPVYKHMFSKVHGVSRDRLGRLTNLLVKNETPVDMRGKIEVETL